MELYILHSNKLFLSIKKKKLFLHLHFAYADISPNHLCNNTFIISMGLLIVLFFVYTEIFLKNAQSLRAGSTHCKKKNSLNVRSRDKNDLVSQKYRVSHWNPYTNLM